MKKFAFFIALIILLSGFPQIAMASSRNEILMKGDKDSYVLELQQALFNQGYLKVQPTGYFGTDTEAAVIAFQKKKDLKADGKAGPTTRKALLGDKYKPIGEKRYVTKKVSDNLYPGDRGDDVKELQQLLKQLGYYKYSSITGYYGPSTQEAVRRFLKCNGLKIDDGVDTNMLKLLKSGDAKYYTLCYKDKGEDVEELQGRLKQLGYYTKKITGYFGSYTLSALKSFQSNNRLNADGKAGKNTLSILSSDNAVKASKEVKKADADKTKTEPKPKIVGRTKIEKVINYAKTHVGKKYRRGAEGPSRFDCSGFVQYCMKYIGVKLPRTSKNMSAMGQYEKIAKISRLTAGDLVFFRTSKTSSIGHVGMYIGGNRFIHCAPGVGVEIRTFVKGSYYYRQFRWGRRVLV